MVNMKKLDFFNIITGETAKPEEYGVDGKVYKKSDNVDMLFDSGGRYLGIRTCRGKFIEDKNGIKVYTGKKGQYYFKSFLDMNEYPMQPYDLKFLETETGNFAFARIKSKTDAMLIA